MKTLIKQPTERIIVPVELGSTIVQSFPPIIASRRLVIEQVALGVTELLVAGSLSLSIFGGTNGERYLVTAKAETVAEERREAEFEIWVIDLVWTMPDGGAPMLTIAEFVDRFGIDEVVRMTDERGDGRIGKERLVAALTDAQAQAEAHISARYALPLADVPVLLKMAIADIARGRLYPGTAPEGVASLAKAAARTLERIQSGALPVAGATSAASSASETPIVSHSGGRAYPDGLKDFGL